MRKIIYSKLIIACLLCAVICVSCKQSAKNQLIGKWKVNGKATVAKMDEETKKNFGGEKIAIEILDTFKIEYKKDGTYSATNNEAGIWSVSEDEKTLSITAKDKKEQKVIIVDISSSQFVLKNIPNISTPVVYDIEE